MNLVSGDNIYNNYSHSSCVDWKIKKITDAHLKVLEFNINKPKTGLKKIDSNININVNVNVNDNEIDNMNNKEAIYPSDYLTNDECSNIEDHET